MINIVILFYDISEISEACIPMHYFRVKTFDALGKLGLNHFACIRIFFVLNIHLFWIREFGHKMRSFCLLLCFFYRKAMVVV